MLRQYNPLSAIPDDVRKICDVTNTKKIFIRGLYGRLFYYLAKFRKPREMRVENWQEIMRKLKFCMDSVRVGIPIRH